MSDLTAAIDRPRVLTPEEQTEVARLRGESFDDMEGEICDLVRMKNLMQLALDEVDIEHRDELTCFAIEKLSEAIDALRTRYYARHAAARETVIGA